MIMGPLLLAIAGVCYLTNSFVDFVALGLAAYALALLIGPSVAETSLCLWLLLKGLNVARWQESEHRAVATISFPS